MDYIDGKYLSYPFESALVTHCVEWAKEISEGSSYNCTGYSGVGAASSADTLAAIKYLVFDTKKVTMDELLDALDHDWTDEGAEKLEKWSFIKDYFKENQEEDEQESRREGPRSLSYKDIVFMMAWHTDLCIS